MSSIQYEITLDLKRDYHQVLVMKEGDVDSREIVATITDNGQLFDVTNHIAKFKWHKPDHKYVFNDCIIQEGKVHIECDGQMLVVGGLANVEVVLYDIDGQTVVSTMKFDVSIKESVISNKDIESTDEFGTLNDVILNNERLANSLKELEENISNAEEERTIAENDRVANEEERVNSFNVLMKEANSEVERLKEENDTASASAELAKEYSNISKSYAVGTGNLIRENDVVDNAKYYYEQARSISEGLNGALIPMGTIMFSDLQNQAKEFGYMYNIKDAFITDDTFKEGNGYAYPAGTNVYWTADSYWDCLAGNAVTGVKGNAESEYRAGNVNITPKNIGALATDGDVANNTVSFEETPELANLMSGEKLSTAFGKIAKAVKDFISHITAKATTSVLGHVKLTDSSAVTDTTGLALPATEKNASIGGTLANQISAINNNLAQLIKTTMVTASADISANSSVFMNVSLPETPSGYRHLFAFIQGGGGSIDTSQLLVGTGTTGCRVYNNLPQKQTVTIECQIVYIKNC